MKAAAAVLIACVGSTHANAFSEDDVLHLSKFCEAATRALEDLPYGVKAGDVDPHAWYDCMLHQGKLRTKEERDRDFSEPCGSAAAEYQKVYCPWQRVFDKSLVSEINDGCESRRPYTHSLWNRCMEANGIFGSRH